MNSKVEKIENNVATLEINLSPEKLEEGMMKSYIKNVKKFNIPGFRKGKAPRKIIEKFYGEGVFFEDAINYVCPDAYDEAVKIHELKTVDRPEIDIVDIEAGKGLVFKAVVTLKPEVELGEYKGIEVEKKEYNVTDEDVNKELEKMREKNARIVDVADRAVKSGDTVTMDFVGFLGDVEFQGGTAKDYKLEIGSGQFIPGFEEGLIGAELGKEIDVNVTFPEKYGNEDLAGKPVLFKVTIKEIKEKQLIDLDDEFAKDVSEFDTLDELKTDISAKLQKDGESRSKTEFEDDAIEKVVFNAKVEIPDVMIDTQVELMIRDFDYQLRQQGLDLKTYMDYMNLDAEGLKEQYKPAAKNRVKTQLVLEKVAEQEKIEANQEDLENELEKTAKQYDQQIEELKSTLKDEQLSYLKDGIIVQKTIDFLIENAKAKQ